MSKNDLMNDRAREYPHARTHARTHDIGTAAAASAVSSSCLAVETAARSDECAYTVIYQLHIFK